MNTSILYIDLRFQEHLFCRVVYLMMQHYLDVVARYLSKLLKLLFDKLFVLIYFDLNERLT